MFRDIALPLIKRGIPVIPLVPHDDMAVPQRGKKALIKDWPNEATTDPQRIEQWHALWPDANVGCVSRGYCYLDDDTGDLKERIEAECGHRLPYTMTVSTSVKPSGKRGKHYYFHATDESLALGNAKLQGVFDFQCEDRQVVGPGSIHPSGIAYELDDAKAKPTHIPDWLVKWIADHNEWKPKSGGHAQEGWAVVEDFDFGDFCDHYGIGGHWEGQLFITDVCPVAGRKHQQSTRTGFLFDGNSLGFHCFATGCEGSSMNAGEVIDYLRKTDKPYPKEIFRDELKEAIAWAEVESADKLTAKPVVADAEERSDEAKGDAEEYELWRDGNRAITGIRLSDVKEAPVQWLWKGRLPAGCGLVVSGAPGTNKSMMCLALITCVTRGWDWPDGEQNLIGPREVLIAATEDDLKTTIKPRLMAMGADCTKITAIAHVFDTDDEGKKISRELRLDEDTRKLHEMLKANPNILMVVLDPLTGFFGNVDGNDNKKIRPMMQRIAKVCRLTGVAFVMLIHENKRSDANSVDRILGAGSVAQVVRAGLRISLDPKNKPDGRIMANIKSNLSRGNGGMRFKVKSKNVTAYDGTELEDIGYIEWGDKHDQSADDVMAEERAAKKEAEDGGTKIEQAMKILKDALADGPQLQREVHPILNAAGISDETKRRARRRLGIRGSQSYPWYWWLPEHEAPKSETSPEEPKMEDVEAM